MDIHFRQIGVIHTPFQSKEKVPIQSARSDAAGTVEIFPEFSEGLEGVEGFSHLYLLYELHLAPAATSLKVMPFLDNQMHGVFATRYPIRPNPLGLSVVRLDERRENLLFVTGIDVVDGTPLLDIKPYIPEFDIHPVTKIGWYANRANP